MNDQRDSPSWLSVGIAWASRITTLALGFAIPVLFGVGLDRSLGTTPLATIAGAVIGFVLFMLHTLRLAKELPSASERNVRRPGGRPESAEDDDCPLRP